jgi:hypothetical protein
MMTNREETWEHLERSLRSLTASLAHRLSEEDRGLLTEFIENREYGVALEWLYLLTAKQNAQPSNQEVEEIRRLAELMEIDLSKVT